MAKTIEEKIVDLELLDEVTEDDVLDLGLGIDKAVENVSIAPPPTATMVIDGKDVSYSADHVFHWIHLQIRDRVLNMDVSMQDDFYSMMHNYSHVLAYLLNDDNNVLINYIEKGEQAWVDIEKHAAVSKMEIDYDAPRAMIAGYEAWKAKNGIV